MRTWIVGIAAVWMALGCGLGGHDFCNPETYGGGPGADGMPQDPAWKGIAPDAGDGRVCVATPTQTTIELPGKRMDAFFALGEQLERDGYQAAWTDLQPEYDILEAAWLKGDDAVVVYAMHRPGWDLTDLKLERRDREYVAWLLTRDQPAE